MTDPILTPTREQLVHSLYEAAELEHNLMCTYLYAAFSLKEASEGLSPEEAQAVARWRQAIMQVAVGEMGHLTAVWNITAALGGAPRFGRGNFPLDPGFLPAGVVVKLAPFSEASLQHFIFLERPIGSLEPEGEGYKLEHPFKRSPGAARLTPMAVDYDTVGEFYTMLERGLKFMAGKLGEGTLFCGSPALQLSSDELDLDGAKPVLCLKTALGACDTIIRQGEGARSDEPDSHFNKFIAIREEFRMLRRKNSAFAPAHPAAHNPVLRRPPNPEGRVWIENPEAAAIVDIANASYQLMLRLIAYAYGVEGPHPEKALAVDLSRELMRAVALLGESAARRPAGPSHPECNAGVSFTALRDAAPLPRGSSSRRFFSERLGELADGAGKLDQNDARVVRAAKLLRALADRGEKGFASIKDEAGKASSHPPAPGEPAAPVLAAKVEDGVETVEGKKITIIYQGKKCIHTRFCVTGAPKVFLANVQGPWIHPDDMDAEELAAIARECPSGAIRYKRNDGAPEEHAPPVNLARITQNGPYWLRGELTIEGASIGTRATLCRCGLSKNKPYCDGSHHDGHFEASGEPETIEDKTAVLKVRDGALEITPTTDGPLMVRGNLEMISGTGRMVARVTTCRLCRCGHSNTKPFCDGTHAKVGFKSSN
jgi:CDGSH-type Zn-finger protein/uncharacterized Fe-S cluster protein YjdI